MRQTDEKGYVGVSTFSHDCVFSKKVLVPDCGNYDDGSPRSPSATANTDISLADHSHIIFRGREDLFDRDVDTEISSCKFHSEPSDSDPCPPGPSCQTGSNHREAMTSQTAYPDAQVRSFLNPISGPIRCPQKVCNQIR